MAIAERFTREETETPVSDLLVNVYGAALKALAPQYCMGPTGDLYLFHTIRHPKELGGGDGHITNVGKMIQLYGAVVAESMREHNENYPPTAQSDPLEYHRRLDGFYRKDRTLADMWDQFSPEQKRRIADRLLQIDADGHDIANTALHVDWEQIQSSRGDLTDAVIPQAVLRYEGSEPQSADMVAEYLRTFRSELGLLREERQLIAAASMVMIKRTKIRSNGFLFLGEPPDAALTALSEFDQLSAVLHNGALPGGIGLGREYGTRIETEGMPQRTINPRGFMSEWFLPDRFRKLKQENGPSIEEFLGFFDQFRKKRDETLLQFARIMDVDPEVIQEIPDLTILAKDRLDMQRQVVTLLWPNDQEVSADRLFTHWTEEEFDLARRACQLFTRHYWDASYTTERLLGDLKE